MATAAPRHRGWRDPARWQPVPRVPPTGRLGPANGLRGVPGLPPEDQHGGINARLARLDELSGWSEAQGAVGAPKTDTAVGFLREMVASAAQDHAERAHGSPEELMDVAVRHGDEHLVKLTDTALDVWSWTGDPAALAAVRRGAALIQPPG